MKSNSLETLFLALLVLAATGVTLRAASKDSADFAHKYECDTDLAGSGEYVKEGTGVDTASGGILDFDNDVYFTNPTFGSTVSSLTGYTIEIRIKMVTGTGLKFGVWPFVESGYCWLVINGDKVTTHSTNGGTLLEAENRDDFHVYRMAFAPNGSVVSVWRDGVILSHTVYNVPNPSGLWTPALYFGAISDGAQSGQIDYIRWTTGAYEPVAPPPPSNANSASWPYQQNGTLGAPPYLLPVSMADAGGGVLDFDGSDSLNGEFKWVTQAADLLAKGYTYEMRIKVIANGDPFGFGVMSGDGQNLSWFGVRPGDVFTQWSPQNLASWGGGPNDDGFHVFRVMHAPGASTLSIWKDGVLLTAAGGVLTPYTTPYFNIGTISTACGVGQLDYFRWTPGAFEPAPASLRGTLVSVTGPPSLDLVEAGGYLALSTAAPTLGGGATARHFLNHYRTSLIRQDGVIEKVSLYVASKPAAVTAFFFEVWRKTGTTWDRVSQENLWPKMVGGRINDLALAAPPRAQEGDYVGYGYTCTSDPGLFLTATTDPELYDPGALYSNKSYSCAAAAYATNSFDWAAQTPSPLFVPIKVYMRQPKLAFIGDSIISGAPNHLSFVDNYFPEAYPGRPPVGIRPETTISYKAGKALNWPYQNLGVAGATTDWLINHGVFNYALQVKPQTVVIGVGINDLATSVSKDAFLGRYTAMLEACRTNGIRAVVNLIMPRTDFSDAKAREMDDWNVSLRALAVACGATVVDARSRVGQFRAGGDPGNYWDLRPEYAADTVHLKPEGHAVVAQAIVEALQP